MTAEAQKLIRGQLMLVWGRTIEEHKIADFDAWLAYCMGLAK